MSTPMSTHKAARSSLGCLTVFSAAAIALIPALHTFRAVGAGVTTRLADDMAYGRPIHFLDVLGPVGAFFVAGLVFIGAFFIVAHIPPRIQRALVDIGVLRPHRPAPPERVDTSLDEQEDRVLDVELLLVGIVLFLVLAALVYAAALVWHFLPWDAIHRWSQRPPYARPEIGVFIYGGIALVGLYFVFATLWALFPPLGGPPPTKNARGGRG